MNKGKLSQEFLTAASTKPANDFSLKYKLVGTLREVVEANNALVTEKIELTKYGNNVFFMKVGDVTIKCYLSQKLKDAHAIEPLAIRDLVDNPLYETKDSRGESVLSVQTPNSGLPELKFAALSFDAVPATEEEGVPA